MSAIIVYILYVAGAVFLLKGVFSTQAFRKYYRVIFGCLGFVWAVSLLHNFYKNA